MVAGKYLHISRMKCSQQNLTQYIAVIVYKLLYNIMTSHFGDNIKQVHLYVIVSIGNSEVVC
jgi:hypothetical protein